jgi:hypothetical protein
MSVCLCLCVWGERTSQRDRAERKAAATTSDGWNRDRMNETHRKGKRSAKKQARRARRRVDRESSQ